jgi:hypothetical protein
MPEPGMELRAFISETLLAVMNGVLAAQEQVQKDGHNGVVCQIERTATHSKPQEIEFDVAITVDAKSEIGAGGGFKLTVPAIQLGLGVDTKVGDRESRTSRVRFKVPVTLPSVNTSPEKDRHLIYQRGGPAESEVR